MSTRSRVAVAAESCERYRLLYDGRGREGQSALLGLVDASFPASEPESSTPTADDLSD